jgi:hypothetical protein
MENNSLTQLEMKRRMQDDAYTEILAQRARDGGGAIDVSIEDLVERRMLEDDAYTVILAQRARDGGGVIDVSHEDLVQRGMRHLTMMRDGRVGQIRTAVEYPASGRSAILVRVHLSDEIGVIDQNDLIELQDYRITIGFEGDSVSVPSAINDWNMNVSTAVFTPGKNGTHVVGNVWMGTEIRVGTKPYYHSREHTLQEGEIVMLGSRSLRYRYSSIAMHRAVAMEGQAEAQARVELDEKVKKMRRHPSTRANEAKIAKFITDSQ